MKCNICGADTMSCSDGTYICSKGHINIPTYEPQNCDMPLPQGFGARYGWICPRCGKVNSPDTRSCDCSSGKTTITMGSTISLTETASNYETQLNKVDTTDTDSIEGNYDPTITLRNNK